MLSFPSRFCGLSNIQGADLFLTLFSQVERDYYADKTQTVLEDLCYCVEYELSLSLEKKARSPASESPKDSSVFVSLRPLETTSRFEEHGTVVRISAIFHGPCAR